MHTIVRMKFGSHLYGTSTPASDVDFKSVFIPSAHDILMQTVPGTIHEGRQKTAGEKNLPGDVEEEKISIQKFLHLAADGQTVALDMLFAPAKMIEPPENAITWTFWNDIQENRRKLLSRKSTAFVGYCRQQANKYGIKGSRIAAVRKALEVIDDGIAKHGHLEPLGMMQAEIEQACGLHSSIKANTLPHGQQQVYWEVCGKSLPLDASLKNAREIMARIMDAAGSRSLQAEKNQGVDWKALSHAVRVGYQALELLETHHITFPLPDAKKILAIKLGELPYNEVATEIEDLLERVEAAALKSSLPDRADQAWINDLVMEAHLWSVR